MFYIYIIFVCIEEEEEEYFITNFRPTRSNMKIKHMTIGMQNKLQNKNRRTIKKKHMYKINMIC